MKDILIKIFTSEEHVEGWMEANGSKWWSLMINSNQRAYNNMVYNFIIHLVIGISVALELQSNYNYSLVSEYALLSQPLLLTHRLPNLSQRPPLIEQFPLKKYQLKDTEYEINDFQLDQIDHQMLYSMEPPNGLFSFEVMSIENYHLLEIRQFQIKLTNPSKKFKLCINEIVIDSEQIRRNDERGLLPFCLGPSRHQVFNFSLYVASPHPALVRVNIYFMVEIYDKKDLVQEKAYARKVYAAVTPNHLKLETCYFKKCPNAQTLVIHNYEIYQIGLRFESRKKLQTTNGDPIEGEVRLRQGKQIHIELQGKAMQVIIHSFGVNDLRSLPSLLLKAHCEEPLIIDYHNIGILTDERMVVDLPLTVTSRAAHNISLFDIEVQATSQTVQIESRHHIDFTITPLARSIAVGMLRIHSSKSPERRSTITVKVRYQINSEQKIAIQKFVYGEIRNAISVGSKRFIDVTKPIPNQKQLQSRFPIKNNLNVPIYLNRISVDQSIFQLVWQNDRRKLIYPNHSVQQFSLVYIGSLKLPLSSIKYVAILQFNGHLLVPLQITIYDHTLQCLYNNIVHKCATLPPLDFGYFRDSNLKSKQLVIRNWNPESKIVNLGINQIQALNHGYNASLRAYRPGLGGDHEMKAGKMEMQFVLKAHQFLLLHIEMQPLQNATSGQMSLQLSTANEAVTCPILAHIQNGTIALIPQSIRIANTFSKQIQYINLVSTYSQEYNIKNVSTNLTGLTVHYSQPPTILENQWIGMSIVYDPQTQNYSAGKWYTDLQFLDHRLARKYERTKYAKIKLITTTDLQTSSTVVIDDQFPELIADADPGFELEGINQIKKLVLKRKKKPNKRSDRLFGEIKLTISNPLETAIKYSAHILSQPKLRNAEKTMRQYRHILSQQQEQIYFCVSEELKTKMHVNAQKIQTWFRLERLPEQCISQFVNGEVIVLDPRRQRLLIPSNRTLYYISNSFRNNCKICYRFIHRLGIVRLIHTEFINILLYDSGLTHISDFLKHEFDNLQNLRLYEQEYLDMYSQPKQTFAKYCQTNPEAMMLRFCHYLNTKILHITDKSSKNRILPPSESPVMLYPGQTHQILINVSFQSGRQKSQFFLVLANNFTIFETYRVTCYLQEPSISVESHHNSLQFGSEREVEVRKRSSQQVVQLHRGDYKEEQGVIEGERIFEIINDGEIDIEISHIGIDDKENICSFNQIEFRGLVCTADSLEKEWISPTSTEEHTFKKSPENQFFNIRSHSSANFSISFRFNVLQSGVVRPKIFPLHRDKYQFSVYLYDQKGYFFKIELSMRIGDHELKRTLQHLSSKDMRHPLLNYEAINIISAVMVIILFLKIKIESKDMRNSTKIAEKSENHESRNKLYKMKRLSKIIRQSSYSDTDSSIGFRLVKRPADKPVHTISEDLLQSVCQVKQRELKKYFNQSEESEIGAIIGFNHHLSLSQSMSYENEEHDNNQKSEENSEFGIECQESDSSLSMLPEGEEVDLTDEMDEDTSWVDYSSYENLRPNQNVLESDEFYNVFRTEMMLRKYPQNSSHLHRKYE